MILDKWISEKIKVNKELTRENLDKYQLTTLNNLIKYAKENSKFYEKLYKDIDEINSLDELYKIPTINKEDIIENGNKMVCVNQSEISRIVSINTSGTMGSHKRIFFTEEDQNLTVDFFVHGLSFLVSKNDTMMIMMPCKTENSVGDLIRKALTIMGVNPVLNGTLMSFKETTNLMIKNKVNSIVGMPVEILALGRYIKHENLPIKIKSILLSADMVNNVLIEEIKQIYNCEVYNHFGMTETGLGGAVECEYHNGMHIRENDLLIEIVNPITKEKVENGESGEILVTTLTRKAMPLIRYETGDIASFVKGDCSCKSVLKRLDNIKYRMDDRVNIGKNIYINISMVDSILFKLENLINYKIEVENCDTYYELQLQLAFLDEDDKKDNTNYNEELKNKIKTLLLENSRIRKSYEMGMLNFAIELTYTKEYINFYKGKRKIISTEKIKV